MYHYAEIECAWMGGMGDNSFRKSAALMTITGVPNGGKQLRPCLAMPARPARLPARVVVRIAGPTAGFARVSTCPQTTPTSGCQLPVGTIGGHDSWQRAQEQ